MSTWTSRSSIKYKISVTLHKLTYLSRPINSLLRILSSEVAGICRVPSEEGRDDCFYSRSPPCPLQPPSLHQPWETASYKSHPAVTAWIAKLCSKQCQKLGAAEQEQWEVWVTELFRAHVSFWHQFWSQNSFLHMQWSYIAIWSKRGDEETKLLAQLQNPTFFCSKPFFSLFWSICSYSWLVVVKTNRRAYKLCSAKYPVYLHTAAPTTNILIHEKNPDYLAVL